ncbi:MAG: class I SAM-dependent DNA methyltransferase [Candidatus Saccharibacteria bacterium]
MNTFDERAKTWDQNPVNRERSEAIAQKIQQKIDLNPGMVAMEYGAGTGTLSFMLKDKVKEITLMDSSVEMVKVMEQKMQSSGEGHLKPLFFNLETNDYTDQTFDLIVTQMVMHHVGDINGIIRKFYSLLNDGGYLVIADLYTEDGSFHGEGFEGHLGFDPERLGDQLKQQGFKDIAHEPCFIMKKQTDKYGLKEFSIFILTAIK